MSQIVDVSPVTVTNAPDAGRSVIGRMLSIACSPDGQALYAGSYSNLWASDDGGQTWDQLVWPQPDPDQFDVPGSLGGWCVVDIAVALGWRVEKHPRFLATLTNSGFADIVGFGDCGVWTALGNGDGSFQQPNVVIPNLGFHAGNWQVDKHPRFVVDLNGDGLADIIGFGDAGVWTAIGNGDGTFQGPNFVLDNFGYNQGWRVDRHPRFVLDINGDGFADIIGFGDAGVWTAIGNGDGSFQAPQPVHPNFGYNQGWRVERHPRFVADLDGDGLADIIAFADDGVWTALQNPDGTFRELSPEPVLKNFGSQQGWQVDKHPRFVLDIDGDGHPDIIGFGDAGVLTAIGNGDGTFQAPNTVCDNFGYNQGWRVGQHPRFVVDLNGDGRADIVGFGDAGVWTALQNPDGTFDAGYVHANFGTEQGWRGDRHPRLVGSLTGSGGADIVGFGDAGVWTALGDGQGGFPASNFVLANFGYGTIVLAITRNDRVTTSPGSRGIWRSTDGGATWTQVYQFPSVEAVGQLQWALGSDHLVYAAGGSALAISKNAGATFETVFPWGDGPPLRVNHVAVWQNSPADPAPAVIYALGDSAMFLSFDGGATWMRDKAALPLNVGGAVSSVANFNAPSVMVISPRFPLEVFIAQNGSSGPAMLYRFDYSQFPFGNQTSTWEPVILPDQLADLSTQDSGNVFLATTQKGRGDLLFYGAQRPVAYVGPLYPAAASDWRTLDQVHWDLHGLLLSPDFHAAINDGNYRPGAGTVWLLSDGGIHRSTDGGETFHPARNARTLSCVGVAGVATPANGPALSLNTGDNDGFYSMDGGQNWSYQQYGGGDNDGAFADPLRSHAMLVFTPRWDSAGNQAYTRFGQTVSVYQTHPGNLPDGRAGTHDRRAVTGPPPFPDSVVNPPDLWNAFNPVPNSYVSRGTRPIVLGLPGEVAPTQGDYIFILSPTTQPVLVRTQNILDIVHRDEWITTATGPGQGANVYLQGPPLPLPDLGVAQASGGHGAPVFYVGGCGLGGNGTLWTWTEGAANWNQIVPAQPVRGVSVGASFAVRFFVSPYQPGLIYILDSGQVKRSDDGGATWNRDVSLETQLTWNNRIAVSSSDDSSGLGDRFDLVLTDMQFDPYNPPVRFAVGEGGAFVTIDGVNWTQLLHTGALAGRPANCYYDWISPSAPSLYVAFAGRSLVKIADLLLTTIF
ncbi:MAG TPA: hypothetical protein VE959_04680 [Bryobacteraceae bacterium]|nr:hypothetical protein [Bryobacteraceae bacterium]